MTTQELLQRMVMVSYWRYINEKTPEAREEWEHVAAQYKRYKEAELKEKANARQEDAGVHPASNEAGGSSGSGVQSLQGVQSKPNQ